MNKRVIHTIIDNNAARFPDHIAIEDGDHSILTYKELKIKSDNCAFLLSCQKVPKRAVVAVFLPEGWEYVVAVLGVSKNGNVFMPLVPGYPKERLRHLLATVKPKAIITAPEYMKEASELLSGDCLLLDIHTQATPVVLPEVDGDDSSYLIYTSGSTGEPKTIEGVHKSLSHFLHWEMQEFQLDATVRTLLLAPVSFDVSFRDIFIPLLCGGTLSIPERTIKTDPQTLLEWIGRHKITLLHIVPSVFRLLIKTLDSFPAMHQDLLTVKTILLAGEPTYYSDVANWRKHNGTSATLVNLYGPSETTLAKIFYRIDDDANKDGAETVPLGYPLPNTIVLILNDADQICQIGEIGEICIKTPFRSKGYYNDPGLTSEKFRQNPLHNDFEDIIYRTGDLGKYGPERRILIVGRKDSQVKIRGNRVELAEVEKVLSRFQPITQAIVLPYSRDNGELVLTAYYTASADVDRHALTAYMSDFLPDYMHPSYYLLMDSFPLNINGKVNRKALPAPEELLYEQLEYTPASNKEEILLCDIFSEVLGLKKVGINNSFFELGGHSLNAVKVISRLYKQTNRQISLKFFFEHPTVKLLAAKLPYIRTSAFVQIPTAPPAALYPVSHSQKRLLVLDQVVNELTAYNMVTACFFAASLNVNAFKRAFGNVIARHEVFKTRFALSEGTFWFYIVEEQPGLAIDPENNISPEQLLSEEQEHYFNLYKDVLYRGRLIRQQDGRYLFIFNIHHIIFDGWSMNIFIEELLALYKAQTDTLPPKSLHYKDYAVWQLNRLANGELDEHKAYWHTVMQSPPAGEGLPLDMERTNDTDFGGDVHTLYLPKESKEALKAIAIANGTSLFSLLLALVKVLLYIKSGNNDIVVGVPVAGRNHPGLEDQIGFFLNNMLLRSQIKRDADFTSLIKYVHANMILAQEHQDYPFDKLVEELTEGQLALYNVLVVMNNDGLNVSARDLNALQKEMGMELYDIPAKISKLDLTFFLMEEKDHIRIDLEYNTKLFRPATISQYAEDLEKLVKQVIENPLITISDLSWLLAAREKKVQLESKINLISEDF